MSETAPPGPLREGDFLGPYRITGLLARGRQWDVYLARSGGEQRQVALKTPASGSGVDADTLLARARRAAGVEHPNLARIYEAGVDRGRVFVAEELLADQRGTVTDLATEMLNHGNRLPEDRVRVLAKHLLDGLAAAHRGGLVIALPDPGTVLLSAQRRAKFVNAGLRAEPTDEARAEDLRALGGLLYRMLAGRPLASDAPSPQQLGLAPGWSGILQALGSARPGAMPDVLALSEQVLTLDSGEPRRRSPWLLPALAAVLFLVLSAVAGLAVRARREAVARAQAAVAARLAADRQAQIGNLLTQARGALDRGDPVAAQAACREVLALDAQQAEALKLLAQGRTVAGLAQMGDAKERAEAAWQTIRDVPPSEGFAGLLSEVRSTLAAARNALAGQEFAQAGTLFRQAAEQATAIAQLEAQRREASPVREEVAQARDSAEAAGAPSLAADLWQQAEARDQAAQEHFGARRFAEATAAWREAADLYPRAQRKAAGSGRLTVVRNDFEAAFAAAGETTREAMPAETSARVQSLCEEAKALAEREDWSGATARWEAALQTFEEGLKQSDAVLRRRHFDEAMERARYTLSRNALAEAEKSLREALGIVGFRENEAARRLLADVRSRREKEGDTGPGRNENLVLNGDFTVAQADIPVGWTRPDNLTVFWEDGGIHGKGKCLRLDTDVYRNEWEAHRKDPTQPVSKTPTTGLKYDTVGGTAGVAVFSHPIVVEAGGCYRVSYDVKGQGEPFIFVLGYWKCGLEHLKDMGTKYFFKPVPGGPSFSLVAYNTSGEEKRPPEAGDFIMSYRRRVVARFPGGAEGTWRHYETVLQFPADSPIQVALLELYAYWPPGDYWFDNVRLERVTAEDLQAYEAKREAAGAEANFGTAVE
jgi:hypothetical protein